MVRFNVSSLLCTCICVLLVAVAGQPGFAQALQEKALIDEWFEPGLETSLTGTNVIDGKNGVHTYDVAYDPTRDVTHMVYWTTEQLTSGSGCIETVQVLKHVLHRNSTQTWEPAQAIPLGLLDGPVGSSEFVGCYDVGLAANPGQFETSSCSGASDVFTRSGVDDNTAPVDNSCVALPKPCGHAERRAISIAVNPDTGDLGILYALYWKTRVGSPADDWYQGDIRFVRLEPGPSMDWDATGAVPSPSIQIPGVTGDLSNSPWVISPNTLLATGELDDPSYSLNDFHIALSLDYHSDGVDLVPAFAAVGGRSATHTDTTAAPIPPPDPIMNAHVYYVQSDDQDFCSFVNRHVYAFAGDWQLFGSEFSSSFESSARASTVDMVEDASGHVHIAFMQEASPSAADPTIVPGSPERVPLLTAYSTPIVVHLDVSPIVGTTDARYVPSSIDGDGARNILGSENPRFLDLALDTAGVDYVDLHLVFEERTTDTNGSLREDLRYNTFDSNAQPEGGSWQSVSELITTHHLGSQIITPHGVHSRLRLGSLLVADEDAALALNPPQTLQPKYKVRIITEGSANDEDGLFQFFYEYDPGHWDSEFGFDNLNISSFGAARAFVNPNTGLPVIAGIGQHNPIGIWSDVNNLYVQVWDQTNTPVGACFNQNYLPNLDHPSTVPHTVTVTATGNGGAGTLTDSCPPPAGPAGGGGPCTFEWLANRDAQDGTTTPSTLVAGSSARVYVHPEPVAPQSFTGTFRGMLDTSVCTPGVQPFWGVDFTALPLPYGGTLMLDGAVQRSGTTLNAIPDTSCPTDTHYFYSPPTTIVTPYALPSTLDPTLAIEGVYNCSETKNTSCGAAPLYGEVPITQSLGNALLPLIPAGLALLGWTVVRRKRASRS